MTSDDTALAGELARTAVALLQELRAASALQGAALKDAGDTASERFLADRFRVDRPEDAVLSEEAVDDPARLSADRVWIVDPLDGTREFSEGRDDWAVHVALWERGRGLAAGAVATPTGMRTTGDAAPADHGLAAVLEGIRPLRLAVSRSRPPALVGGLLDLLRAEAVPMGSAGVKALAVVRGDADAYVHAGGQYEWDSAAPVAVARAAGLHTSRIDGSPLEYNRSDPLLPDLVICPPVVADRLLGTIATVLEGEA